MHRTLLVSLTVLSIIAAVAVPAMAAGVSSNTSRQANTITEKVISTRAASPRTVEETPSPNASDTDSLEESTKGATIDPFTGRKLVPARSSPVDLGNSSQATEKETIAEELQQSMEGMAVGEPVKKQVAKKEQNQKKKEKPEEKKDNGPSVMDLPPFAERFPPDSIKSTARAEEVIEAYKKELSAINKWSSDQERPCYRSFFVNWCLNKAKEKARDKKNAAKAVWVVARDFIRKEKSAQAIAERKAKDKERAELVARIEAQAPKPKGTGLVSSAPDADIDTRGFMTVNDGKRTDIPKEAAPQQPVLTKQSKPATPAPAGATPEAPEKETQVAKEAQPAKEQPPASSGQRLNLVEPRELTLEQEEANELEYERREMAREEKVQKAEEEEPTPPSTTEEERAASRDARRKAAEQKRQENIRKRKQREEEYERQVKLREQQNGKKN